MCYVSFPQLFLSNSCLYNHTEELNYGIIQLMRTHNFPKNEHLLPPATHVYDTPMKILRTCFMDDPLVKLQVSSSTFH